MDQRSQTQEATAEGRTRRQLFISLLRGCILGLALTLFVTFFAPAQTTTDVLRTYMSFLLMAAFIRAAYICLPFAKQDSVRRWFTQAYRDLSKQQKRYLIAACLMILVAHAWFIGATGMLREPLICMFLFVFFVAMRDAIDWYAAISDKILGKAFITISFVTGSTVAYGLAAQQIAIATNAIPVSFTRAAVLAAIMQIPVLVPVAAAVISAFFMTLSSLLMAPAMIPGARHIIALFIDERPPATEQRFIFITRFFQIVIFSSLGPILFSLSQKTSAAYEAFVMKQIKTIVYELDMYPSSECNLEKGYKIAALGDSRFLIGTRGATGEINFLPLRKCDQ